jgi:4-hydroxyphenylacetate 3-monooxygenase
VCKEQGRCLKPALTTSIDCGMVEGMVRGMEAAGTHFGPYYVPHKRLLYAAQVLTQQLYPQVIHAIRELAGGGLIMLPSSVADFANPEIVSYIEKTQPSPAGSAMDRIKLFKLAWDAVGSEFGSRHTQSEMFYAGAVTRGHAFRTCDWEQVTEIVDGFLARYGVPKPGV